MVTGGQGVDKAMFAKGPGEMARQGTVCGEKTGYIQDENLAVKMVVDSLSVRCHESSHMLLANLFSRSVFVFAGNTASPPSSNR